MIPAGEVQLAGGRAAGGEAPHQLRALPVPHARPDRPASVVRPLTHVPIWRPVQILPWHRSAYLQPHTPALHCIHEGWGYDLHAWHIWMAAKRPVCCADYLSWQEVALSVPAATGLHIHMAFASPLYSSFHMDQSVHCICDDWGYDLHAWHICRQLQLRDPGVMQGDQSSRL